ncbi:MAG: flagellar hook-basal body complex protein FliE [Acidobacteria bacterium]|nr:flagellar hook-basal body complex protein FliE [Acidobacteriota bacterium]
MATIHGMNAIAPVPSIDGIKKPSAAPEKGAAFGDIFQEAVGQVEQYRVHAEGAANRFMNGETEEIHQVILAGQRAEIAFETFLQVRNKVVQAYQEVMRMQM